MITEYDGVKIGLYHYDMTDGFVEGATEVVKTICNQINLINTKVSTAPVISFWNVRDNGKRLYDLPEFKEYLTFIKPHIREYLKELEISEDDAVVTAMWGVHYKPGKFVDRHNHTYKDYNRGTAKHVNDKDVLGVLLYLNKPDNSGNLFIETANAEHEFDLKAGDVIMFPSSSSWHRTDPNNSGEDKYVVGIEIVMKWVTDDKIVGKTLEEL